MSRKRNRKAFTIVELVIVIAVIAILATTLVPTFGDVIDKAQISAARSDAMNLYKQYAISEAGIGDASGEILIQGGNDKFFVIVNGEMQDQIYPTAKEAGTVFAHLKLLSMVDGHFVLEGLGYSNVLVVGNSWTIHPPYSNYWFEDRGMAASVPGNDFVSLLEIGLKAYQGNVSVDRINIANWEREGDAYIHEVDALLSSDTDLIVLRFGENLSTQDRYYDRLLNYINHMKALAPNAEIVVCTTGLEASLAATTKAAGIAAGAHIAEADFSDPNNDVWEGQYIQADSLPEGFHRIERIVVGHPSDVGMAMVANSVLSAIGYDNINVVYDIRYEGIDSAGYRNHTQWVRDGLVRVKSTAAISVTAESGRSIDVVNRGDGFYTFYMPNENVTVSCAS